MPARKQELLVQLSTTVDSTVTFHTCFGLELVCLCPLWLPSFHAPCPSFAVFQNFWVLRCLSRFWTLLPHCVIQHMCSDVLSSPLRLAGSVQRLDLRFSPFSALSGVFPHVRPVAFLCSVGGRFLSSFGVLVFTRFYSYCSLSPFFDFWFSFSFIFSIFFLLPSPSNSTLPFHTLALFGNWGTTYAKPLYHVRTPPPLYNGGTFAKSISVWIMDFVHETDSYTNPKRLCLLCSTALHRSSSLGTERAWALSSG